LATGQNDNSYGGGSKEDDTCPGVGTGSIPNNKSDLKTFGVYVEPGSSPTDPGFLNLYWTRVQVPSGTTLMDFELNQSSTICANGVNPARTVGDLLIEYRIEQGGATATIKVREWTGSAWGAATDLTGNQATGTINTTAISADDAGGPDGLGSLSPRTFGEAQLDLDFIFNAGECESFGSAFLKSRSSDSFTSQLKDFIAPTPVSITNCGQVTIRKQTSPDENPNTTNFGYTKNFSTDPDSTDTFTLQDDGVKTFNNVIFGNGSVTEDVIPAGWNFQGLDCSASSGVLPQVNGATATWTIDSSSDKVDCTYTNQARGSIVVEKITDDGSGAFDFTSNTLTPSPFTLTTTAAGAGGKDSRTFADLGPGIYDVAETMPSGWNLVSSTCDDNNSNPSSIDLSAGETVTCTFHDARETGAIQITKTRKHAADGSGDHPHAGVDFVITGGELPQGGTTVTTNADGVACLGGLQLSSPSVGDYTVHEVVPNGYNGEADKTVTVDNEAACGDNPYGGETVSFSNTPLTDITVSVDSQVDGGTASTMDCGAGPRSLPGPMVMDPLRATTSSPVPIPALSSSTHNLRKELTLKEGGALPHPLCMREGDYFGRPISVRSVRLRPALLVLPTVLCQGSPDDSRPGRHSADRNEEDRWHDHLPPVRLTPAPRQRSE